MSRLTVWLFGAQPKEPAPERKNGDLPAGPPQALPAKPPALPKSRRLRSIVLGIVSFVVVAALVWISWWGLTSPSSPFTTDPNDVVLEGQQFEGATAGEVATGVTQNAAQATGYSPEVVQQHYCVFMVVGQEGRKAFIRSAREQGVSKADVDRVLAAILSRCQPGVGV